MTDQIEKEGVVQAVTEKWGGGVQLDGDWYSYTKHADMDDWHKPKKGDKVRLVLNPWEKDDGTTKLYVVGIESLNGFEEPEVNPFEPKAVSQSREPFRSPAMLNRTEALKLAVEALGSPPTGGEAQYGAEAVALAAQLVAFIEGDFDAG